MELYPFKPEKCNEEIGSLRETLEGILHTQVLPLRGSYVIEDSGSVVTTYDIAMNDTLLRETLRVLKSTIFRDESLALNVKYALQILV